MIPWRYISPLGRCAHRASSDASANGGHEHKSESPSTIDGRVEAALRRWAESPEEPAPAFPPPDHFEAIALPPADLACEPKPQPVSTPVEALGPDIQDTSGTESRSGEDHGGRKEPPKPAADMPNFHENTDYYELLQISRNADMETIHRVYRFMAARLHPDNAATGDANRFVLLTQAYQVLTDPARRMQYDALLLTQEAHSLPVFHLKDFVHGVEGEANRRLGILSLLYLYRRRSEVVPGMSVLDLERRMAFPREHLNFTLWYLRERGYVRLEENSDYSLTADGVDYVERYSSTNAIVRELLAAPSGPPASAPSSGERQQPDNTPAETPARFDAARCAA